MSLIKIVFSPTGGTKKAVDIIGGEISCESVSLDLMGNVSGQGIQIGREDVCLIGVPSFGGRVPVPAAERLAGIKAEGAKAILVVSYGNRAYDDTFVELEDIAEKAGFVCVAAVAAVTQHSIMPGFGAGRPDSQDEKELREFGKKIAGQLERNIREGRAFPPLEVPGNRPYREFGGLPMKPKASSACSGCGACAKICPTGAIDRADLRHTDAAKCITCMGCVAVCPSHARKLNPLLLAVATRKMKKVCGGRRENECMMGE